MTNQKIKKLVTITACLAAMLCAGILYLWSAFTKGVQAHYSLKEGAAGLVGSFMIFGFVVGNLLGGILGDKYSPKLSAFCGSVLFGGGIFLTSLLTKGSAKLIYITYSGIAGLGCGFAYGSILKILQKWFPTRRGFASGLSVSAFAASAVIFAPLTRELLKHYNISLIFRVLGLVFWGIMITACLLIRLPDDPVTENGQIPVQAQGLSPAQAIRKGAFWCIFFSSFFINATWNILMPQIQTLAETRGLKGAWISAAVVVTGIANAIGRLSIASASDKIKRSAIMIAMALITLVCAVLLIWAGGYAYLILIAFVAFAYGGPSATMPAMTVDIAGAKYSGTNYGIILLSLGFSSVIFSQLSNVLKRQTGSLTASFVMAAITCVIPIILMFVYDKLRNRRLNEVNL